jgi:predicted O-methyltransferase YrrM
MLECGTGLSTVLMAMIALETGAQVTSLEHDETWYKIVRSRLDELRLTNTGVVLSPLRSFGEFSWYDFDSKIASDTKFDLVLCDGPPNSTSGGRYGLLPRVFQKLRSGATIVVDDSHREDEVRMIQRWIAEYKGKICTESTHATFTILKVT